MSEYNPLHHAFYEIANSKSFSHWSENWPKGSNENVSVRNLVVSVLEVKEDDRDGDGYGEYRQGSEADTYILFKVEYPDKAVRFFRQLGVYNSYGDARWDGKFEEVQVVTKTVEVYEPVG